MNELLLTSLILIAIVFIADSTLGFKLLKARGELTLKNMLGYMLGASLGFVLGIFILSPVVLLTKRIDIFRKHRESLITKVFMLSLQI